MYYGKMTPKLEKLYEEYHKKWGVYPDFYEDTEYGENTYFDFVRDIKKALKRGIELPDLYPYDPDEWI